MCPKSQIASKTGGVLAAERAAVCLAIPGKVLEIQELGPLRSARVQFGGIVRQVSLNFVPEAGLGDYVMVHVGFAISRVDADEAERTYKLLEEMGALEAELPPAES
jgi:hydrogenase expression/formation protein HypC